MTLEGEFSKLDATAQAELVHRKEVKPAELVQAVIDRIEKMAWTLRNNLYMMGRMPAEGELEPVTIAYDEMGKSISGADYLIAVQYIQLLARQIAGFMKDYDVLLTPTLGSPPLPLGSFGPTQEDRLALGVASRFVPFTPIFNATGQPAMSVPLYWNSEDQPIGTHFAGRFGDEATLFRLAAQMEQARPWANRIPEIVRQNS